MVEEPGFRLELKLTGTAPSETPVAVNCSVVHVAQGSGYIDFGFLEPQTLFGLTQMAKTGQKLPERVEGRLVLRVAISPEAMEQLAKQIDDVLSRTGLLKAENLK